MVIITTTLWRPPISTRIKGMVRRPSMAVVTVTAGVKIPSASSAAPPIIAGIISHFPKRFTSEYSAKIPPSLWLSALIATNTYFTVVIRVSVQIISERAPNTTSSFIVISPPLPVIMALSVYMGLVPMSPYTIPRVTSIMDALKGIDGILARAVAATRPVCPMRPVTFAFCIDCILPPDAPEDDVNMNT